MLEFQVSNHVLVMDLTPMHALDQGPRDLFPPEWEDHHDFEAGTVIDRRGPASGSYTEIRVDDSPRNVSFPTASTALPTRRIMGQLGAASPDRTCEGEDLEIFKKGLLLMVAYTVTVQGKRITLSRNPPG